MSFWPRRRDVDRPIFYSVAVIIAGYIPDLRAERAIGKAFSSDGGYDVDRADWALILTLTFVPVMCAYWFKGGVREQVNKPFEWMRRIYAGELEWCLDHPKLDDVWPRPSFLALTLLLVPFIGGEFMPHLDEGALWVRATMPYTISFEEASKFSPEIRNMLMQYPHGDRRGLGTGTPR